MPQLARLGPIAQLRAGRLTRRLGQLAVGLVLYGLTLAMMIRATIGVITNVRLDHTEVMGRDLASIAGSLANTIPAGGVVVTSASAFTAAFRHRAARLGASVVVADFGRKDPGSPTAGTGWLAEDVALALAVTRQLGIDDGVAHAGFARAPDDPGAARQGTRPLPRGPLRWLDATAANDPESLARLLEDFEPWHGSPPGTVVPRPRILVYHHRDDRGPRLECFARHCAAFASSDHLVVSGARPPLTLWKMLTRARAAGTTEFVATGRLAAWLAAHAGHAAVVVCGNARGLDVPRLVEEAASRD